MQTAQPLLDDAATELEMTSKLSVREGNRQLWSVTVSARVFIEATCEGDLAALAGAAYEIGSVQTCSFRVCTTPSPDPADSIGFCSPSL